MRRCLSSVLLLSGLMLSFSLRLHVLRRFHFVDQKMNWSDAQSFCRRTFTDLATIPDQLTNDDLATLPDQNTDADRVAMRLSEDRFWIGLHRSSWRWSEGPPFNGSLWQSSWTKDSNWLDTSNELDTSNQIYNSDQFATSDSQEEELRCVLMDGDGGWITRNCEDRNHFFCFRRSPPGHLLVLKKRSWAAADSYCRSNHLHLSSVFNRNTNDDLRDLLDDSGRSAENTAWIGLHNPEWAWSDGSYTPYRQWREGGAIFKDCAVMIPEDRVWTGSWCYSLRTFVCYSDDEVAPSKTVKLRLKTSADLKDVRVQEAVLLQLKRELASRGVTADLQLSVTSLRKESSPPADDHNTDFNSCS